jgi:DNA-directed RNA polymerase sigma subunit (sigma70/sigma32)
MNKLDILNKHEALINKLSYTNKVYGYDKEDLQQEFRMILLDCVDKFDDKRGIKFSTYFVKSCNNKVRKLRVKEKDEHHASLNVKLGNEDGQEFLDLVEDEVVNPMEYVIGVELNDDIMSELDKLPYGFYSKMYLLYIVELRNF